MTDGCSPPSENEEPTGLSQVTASSSQSDPGCIALWVNGNPVTCQELQIMIRILRSELSINSDDDQQLDYQKMCIEEYVKSYILNQEARVRQLEPDLSKFEIDDLMLESHHFPKGFEALQQEEDAWKNRAMQRVKDLRIAALLSRQLSKDLTVSEDEIKMEYQRQKDKLTVPPQLDLRAIRVYDQNEASEIYQKLKKRWSFTKLADRHSTIKGSGANGEIFRKSIDEFPDNFRESLEKTPLHKFTPILSSPEGYFIFCVEKRYPAFVLPIEEVQDNLRTDILSRRRSQRFRQWMDEQIKQVRIVMGTPVPDQENIP